MGSGKEERVLVDAGPLAIRSMSDDAADYALMSRWLSDERVLEWVYGRDQPFSLERAAEKWGPRARGEDAVRPCIVTYEGQAVGYMQYYPIAESPADYGLGDADGAFGVDMFIGEPELWDSGLGSRALRALVAYLYSEASAQNIVIDPRVTNARAIRAYEKADFRKLKVLRRHEFHEGAWQDNWLMVHHREGSG